MNSVVLMGRLTRDPEVRYSQGERPNCIARYTLAVDRRYRSQNSDQPTADYISCLAFGKFAEIAEKYFKQGTKITIRGRIQTGSYTNRDGQKVYTTDVVVEDQEFAESKASAGQAAGLLILHSQQVQLQAELIASSQLPQTQMEITRIRQQAHHSLRPETSRVHRGMAHP